MAKIRIVYNQLPPSTNHLYVRGSILRTEARKWKEQFKQDVTRAMLPELVSMQETMSDPDSVFAVVLRFFFETVVNETYGKKKGASTRYKRFDLTNRVKFLEDCIRDVLGIDDSRTFCMMLEKHQDAASPRVEIEVWDIPPHTFGVRDATG